MNKFSKILASTGDAVLQRRSDIINQAAACEARDLVQAIEKEIRGYKLEVMNLEDLSVKTTDSLSPAENFDAKAWVAKMMDLKDKLRDANIRLDLAKSIVDEYFTDGENVIDDGARTERN